MREARIILPTHGNGVYGEDALTIHALARGKLVLAFGGITVSAGLGIWKSPEGEEIEEPILIYDIAVGRNLIYDVREANTADATIRRIAVGAAKALKQHSVYVRYTTGDVEIIPIPANDNAQTEEQAHVGI